MRPLLLLLAECAAVLTLVQLCVLNAGLAAWRAAMGCEAWWGPASADPLWIVAEAGRTARGCV